MATRVQAGDFNSFQKAIGEIQSRVDAGKASSSNQSSRIRVTTAPDKPLPSGTMDNGKKIPTPPTTASGRRGFDVSNAVGDREIWNSTRGDINDAKRFGQYKFDTQMGLERSKLNSQNTALQQGAFNDSAKIDLAKREQRANERNQNRSYHLQKANNHRSYQLQSSQLASSNALANKSLGLQDTQSRRQYTLGNRELSLKGSESRRNNLLAQRELGLRETDSRRNYALSQQELAFKNRYLQQARTDNDLNNRRQAMVGMVGNFL